MCVCVCLWELNLIEKLQEFFSLCDFFEYWEKYRVMLQNSEPFFLFISKVKGLRTLVLGISDPVLSTLEEYIIIVARLTTILRKRNNPISMHAHTAVWVSNTNTDLVSGCWPRVFSLLSIFFCWHTQSTFCRILNPLVGQLFPLSLIISHSNHSIAHTHTHTKSFTFPPSVQRIFWCLEPGNS